MRARVPTAILAAAMFALALPAVVIAPAPARAVLPDEVLDDPVLEARARDISRGLRCLVCQNESIDSSNADLARDLRILVRERLVAGDSDDQVRAYLVARYGDFVLLDPPVKPQTYALWAAPGVVLLIGVFAVALYFRGRRTARVAAGPLSEAERARLDDLLRETEPGQRTHSREHS